jgi:hypothetical protein
VTREPDQILSEFIDAWNAGRRPQVNVYLALAPAGQRGELADELSRFLALAPEPAYSPEALDAVRAEAASLAVPLASLLRRARERTRVSVRELGSSLAQALGVSDEAKTAGYLDQLESGSLDPRGLSRRVLDALAASLGVARDQLEAAADRFALPVPPATAAGALWRAEPEAAREERADLELLADAMAAPAPEPWDQIDELFRGGR